MTQLRLLALACASLFATSGCSESLAPAPGDLVGAWASPPSALMPQGWHQFHLRFTTARRFAFEVRTYGLYSGQPADELTAFTRIEGAFRQDGGRLLFDAERHIWWDRFYGKDSPVHIQESYPYGGLFDDAVYEVAGNRLTIHFTTYPADAPEPATAVYFRVE